MVALIDLFFVILLVIITMGKQVDVEVLERPAELRGGMVSMNDVLLNDVRRVDAEEPPKRCA